jgi:CelD/BcsL family acetyltransferase involved in cellulose biosynthesis
MVDATHHFSRAAADAAEKARVAAPAGSLTSTDYARLAKDGIAAPAQSPAWVTSWSAQSGADTLILRIAGLDGTLLLLLPLEIVRKGPFRVARFMGGSHAGENFPPSFGDGDLGAADVRRAVAAVRPDVDLVHLERMWPERLGRPNPVCRLPYSESPNVSLAVSLHGGFDALLERASGKRKRKKHRSQVRKFEAAGGYRRIEAATPEEVDRILGMFFEMKAERFRRMGIADVFAPAGVRAFFADLFKQALAEPRPPFVLHALEIGGKIRAVTGSSRAGERLVCEFGAIAEDELAFASPGEFLFFENIRQACEEGFEIYDFSIGDEPYKRLWCNIETRHFDVIVPVTLKGRVLAAALAAATSVKRMVKQNPVLWGLAKRLRRQAAPASPAAEDD